jgi:hypothetical protein
LDEATFQARLDTGNGALSVIARWFGCLVLDDLAR